MTLDQILLAAILGVLLLRWFSDSALWQRVRGNTPYRIKRLFRRA